MPTTITSTPSSPRQPKDWSATRYLRYATERTLPVHDLIQRLTPYLPSSSTSSTPTPGTPPSPPLRIYDLGCGPGNSTSALLSAFPSATLTGVDTSPSMLTKARAAVPSASFLAADLHTFRPPASDPAGLIFSNATFHWLRSEARIPTLRALFRGLNPAGVLAIQMPDNYHAPSHALMRATALMLSKPWSPWFSGTRIGDVADATRPDLDPVEAPGAYYDAFTAEGATRVEVWRTEYMHVLEDAGAVVEWVSSTGLKPFLERIGDEVARGLFVEEYQRRVGEAYGRLGDGRVLLGYPRLFVVAVKG